MKQLRRQFAQIVLFVQAPERKALRLALVPLAAWCIFRAGHSVGEFAFLLKR